MTTITVKPFSFHAFPVRVRRENRPAKFYFRFQNGTQQSWNDLTHWAYAPRNTKIAAFTMH